MVAYSGCFVSSEWSSKVIWARIMKQATDTCSNFSGYLKYFYNKTYLLILYIHMYI